MHPIERLRYLARLEGEGAVALATEAAWTISDLAASEPAAAVTACRRLLGRHPECGPLWWVSAHLVTTDDPVSTSEARVVELCSDPVPSRLSSALSSRLEGPRTIATSLPLDLVRDAVELGCPASVRIVAEDAGRRLPVSLLVAGAEEVAGFGPSEAESAISGATVVIEALAVGPAAVLVSPSAAVLVHEAERAGSPCWLAVGAGRSLSAPLVAAAAAAAEAAGRAELLSPDEFQLAVDAGGEGDPALAVSRSTCPRGSEVLCRL